MHRFTFDTFMWIAWTIILCLNIVCAVLGKTPTWLMVITLNVLLVLVFIEKDIYNREK